jgi:tetratricopeptide (TPR) repeat protein
MKCQIPVPAATSILLLALTSIHCSKPQPRADGQYVNARTCAACHAVIYQTYRHTGMARAFYPPSPESVQEPRAYFHKASGTWFQSIQKNGVYYQRSWQVGYNGKEDNVSELRIDYVMGSGNHVRTYLHRTARDTLVELPLAWYAEKGGLWAMNPGFDTPRPPIGRKVGYDCMFCHNAYPSTPSGHDDPGAEPVFAFPLPEGIDCQRCHGPGEDHVRAAQGPNAKPEDLKRTIVNPQRSPQRGMHVCMQCHLETTSAPLPNAIRRFDRGPYSYRPGEPLSAFILFFDHPPAAGKEDKFEIVSSAYRLRKSQCFLRSNGALTCTTCHNPHDIPHGSSAGDHYNSACRQCHSVIQTSAHPKDPNCISCHMPKRRTEDVVHGVMTDHLIQRPRAGNLLAEIPERHVEYRGEVIPYGEADEIYTAVAQVTQKSNLDSGIPRLEAAIVSRRPARAEFYLEMGDAYSNAGQYQKALEPYQQAIARRPGSALLLRRLASAFRGSGQSQPALEVLLRATQSEPSNAEAWYDLGLLQSDLGKKEDAIQSLRRSTELDPELADAENSLGAVLAETGQIDRAESAFRAALRIQPMLAPANANLANLLSSKNALAEAVWHYDRAGGTAVDQFNYGVTLARMNRLADAQTHIEAALRQDPNLPEAHDVLGSLLENRGRMDAALAEYREAVRLRPNFGKAHLDLGAVLAARRDFAAAGEEFRKASTDSDSEIRRQAMRALESIAH